ncbi:MAG: hypothetical protein KDE53_19695 [Caldilineaceae bacterium]|nr:hypothetical protein [Caldilineaceae bacterium]MCB0123164.1 hypothetical protein [Caldilineaceae bacterium]MCB0187804.1 hypothetical protein [Caldilineaceae bacterium]HRW09055.1 hypothetical protein [Caldilineaceae bacterium]
MTGEAGAKGLITMSGKQITVTLSESTYKRLTETAHSFAITDEEVISQSMALLLPALESDLPQSEYQDLSKLPLLSDLLLWKVAHSTMDDQRQNALEQLAENQKHRPLTEAEQSELRILMHEAESIMLRKAEASRLLALRGHTVFVPS